MVAAGARPGAGLTVEKIAPELLGLLVRTDSLREYPRNPNEGDPEGIAESLEAFSQYAPLVVQASTRFIVKGNHTFKAAKLLGWKYVAANVMELDDERAKAIVVGDNRHSEKSRRRQDELGELLAELQEANLLAGTGYSDSEVDALLAELEGAGEVADGSDAEATDGDIPVAAAAALTRRGDVWSLGRHRLMCGSARDAADVGRLLGGERAAIAVTSPPYADRREYDGASEFEPVPPEEYADWFAPAADLIAGHLADDGSFFLNMKPHCEDGERLFYVWELVMGLCRARGWRFVDEFCWRNTRDGVPGGWNNRFKNAWEPIFHLCRRQAIKFRPDNVLHATEAAFDYSPRNAKAGSGSGLLGGKPEAGYREGLARPSNVIEASAEGGQSEHTAPFPTALPDFFIRAFTDPGDLVYEPFAGSGTTIVAAEEAEGGPRRCAAMEISPRYCDVILRRYARITGDDPVRHDGARWSALAGGDEPAGAADE